MIDDQYIKIKFIDAKRYLIKIDEFYSLESLDGDFDFQLKGERIFEILTQIILDICTHISSKSNLAVPTSYANCIENLGQLGIILDKDISKFKNLIKMRNVIVHLYDKVNYGLLFEALKSLKNDFTQFQNQILDYLDKN